jgi:hypothetical protein
MQILRDGDGDDDVVELKLLLLKFVLDVDVTTTLTVVRGPTVDCKTIINDVSSKFSTFFNLF